MLLEPGELHYNTQPTPPGTFWVSFIPGSVIEDSAKELGFQLKPHFRLANVAHPALFRAFARFHLSLEETSSTTLERTSRFHHCIGLLLGDYIEEMKTLPTLAPSKAVLRKARDYIVGNFSEKIYLDQLAQLSGLSRFHFLRAFTQEFGLPPHAYQIQARLARVRSLLAAGLSISQVEAETGFCDQSHLTRHFKRAFGVTPGEYAASVRPRLVAVPA
jgi:AraC-like DNA-binding protein